MAPPPPAPRPRRPSRAPPRAGRRLRGRRAAGIGGGPPPSRPLPASRPPPRTRTGRARAWRGEGGCCCGGLRAPGLVAPVPESRPCGSWLLRRPPRPGVGDLPAGGGGKEPDVGRQEYAHSPVTRRAPHMMTSVVLYAPTGRESDSPGRAAFLAAGRRVPAPAPPAAGGGGGGEEGRAGSRQARRAAERPVPAGRRGHPCGRPYSHSG